MPTVQLVIGLLINLLLSPFEKLDPLWPLLLLSLGISLGFLLAFRRLANATRLKGAKDRMQAHLLELRLFKDSPRILFSALGNILIQNVRYLRFSLKPLLVLLLPMALLLVHLDGWFGYRPLLPGESALVTVKLLPGNIGVMKDIALQVPSAITLETLPLRIPAAWEVSWQIRAKEVGTHDLIFRSPASVVTKAIVVSETAWARVWPTTAVSGLWNEFWNPGEAVLSAGSDLQQIRLGYPARSIKVLGWEMHWLLFFFLASCLFGWVASRRMRVVI
jgi:hypothetical protein